PTWLPSCRHSAAMARRRGVKNAHILRNPSPEVPSLALRRACDAFDLRCDSLEVARVRVAIACSNPPRSSAYLASIRRSWARLGGCQDVGWAPVGNYPLASQHHTEPKKG